MGKFTLIISICAMSFFAKGQTVSFTFSGSNGATLCSPATVSFTQTCTGSPIGFTWYFSNGQVSNLPNPVVSFAAGTFTAKLVAVFNSTALEATQTITVNPSITASLTANKNYICLPGIINFTATTTGTISSYEWNFGDGTTLTNNSATIAHNYASLGSYNATVKAIDASGCSATAAYSIVVQNPPISASIAPVAGCIPVTSNFSSAVSVPTGSTVTAYTWTFGDGSPAAVTASATTTHAYIDSGTYLPTLSIVTSEGCTNNYNFPAIAFGIPPLNHVAFPKKLVYCGSETAMFVAKATYANAYKWEYGDGVIETVLDTLAQHKYATLGSKTVKVTPFFNGCAGTPIAFTINVVGVIASFTFANTCTAKKTFAFTNTSLGNQSTTVWSFGDGSPNVTTSNAIHTFPATGIYAINLAIIDNATGCGDTAVNYVYTANPSLTNPDTFVCRNSNTTFTIQNNYVSGGASFEWHVIGLPTVTNSTNPYTIAASTFGNFATNYVVISLGTQYCGDTITLNHPISVRGPNLSYTANSSVCANNPFTVTNTSSPYLASDTVKLWYWNYGIVPTNDTIYQPPIFSYPVAAGFVLKLVAKDKNGCIDSLTKLITVKPTPFLRIFPRADTLCQGQKDSLIAFHSDTLSWRPIPLVSCATCDTTLASPITSTIFYATAINSIGCSITDSSIITVFTPFVAAPVKSPLYACVGDTVHVDVTPSGKKIVWSPPIGLSDSTIYNPLATVTGSTNYTALLTDSVGCFTSTATVNVIAKSTPFVDAGADIILPFNTPFTITPTYGSNITQYEWTPNATLSCGTCPTPSGTAGIGETYTIKVTSDSGCVAKDDINIFVQCEYANLFMPTAFSPNNDQKNDTYYPLSKGIKTIATFIIFNRYGQIVFDAKNLKPNERTLGWNGKYRGQPQPADAYVYLLEVICDQGEKITKKESFLLLR
jgi:gliding motility-associated-like protein